MKKYRFFVIFTVIGALCVIIDYSIYLVLLKATGIFFLSKVCSSVVSVTVNYFLNSRLNFDNKKQANLKFYGAYIGLYSLLILLNAGINQLFLRFDFAVKPSFWLAAAIAALTNYLAVKAFFAYINKNEHQNKKLPLSNP